MNWLRRETCPLLPGLACPQSVWQNLVQIQSDFVCDHYRKEPAVHQDRKEHKENDLTKLALIYFNPECKRIKQIYQTSEKSRVCQKTIKQNIYLLPTGDSFHQKYQLKLYFMAEQRMAGYDIGSQGIVETWVLLAPEAVANAQ